MTSTCACRYGSFYGIVGPNGAGKTTALSMAVGLLRPTSGHALVQGIDVWSDPDRAPSTASACCRTGSRSRSG